MFARQGVLVVALTVIPYSQLTEVEQRILLRATNREFGDVPIVRDHVWSEPDTVILAKDDREILGSVCLVSRQAKFDGQLVSLIGVHNLVVEPEARKKGVGRQLMEAIAQHAKAKAVLLFCADNLVPYYERLGFRQVSCEVWIEQPWGRKKWESNCLVLTQLHLPQRSIDLCGLPF